MAAAVGAWIDAVAIVVIIEINAVVGFDQEYRAEKAVISLRSMTAARARVLRGGRVVEIPSRTVVVGDHLVLEAGDLVAADARLLEAHEPPHQRGGRSPARACRWRRPPCPSRPTCPSPSAATPCSWARPWPPDAAAPWSSTRGWGRRWGGSRTCSRERDSGPTPLQRRLAGLARTFSYVCVALVAAVAVLGAVRGAAVAGGGAHLGLARRRRGARGSARGGDGGAGGRRAPDGRPQRARPSPLGGGDTRLRHRDLHRQDRHADDRGDGRPAHVGTRHAGPPRRGRCLLRRASSGATARAGRRSHRARDPPGGGASTGSIGERIEQERPRMCAQPFDPRRRRMSICAPRRGSIRQGRGRGDRRALSRKEPRARWRRRSEMAARGVAGAGGGGGSRRRGERPAAVRARRDRRCSASRGSAGDRRAHAAGIKVVMITGDHPVTARAIAREMGIVRDGESVPTRWFTRARPRRTRPRSFAGCEARGEIVAMTGDGVNDAPSIREADIGIAMGQTATEVTREASEMILTTDDLSGRGRRGPRGPDHLRQHPQDDRLSPVRQREPSSCSCSSRPRSDGACR